MPFPPPRPLITGRVETFFRLSGRHLHRFGHRQPVANDRLRHMLIGYTRVSKADGSQSLELQRDALQAAGVDAGHVYHDVATSADARAMTDSTTRVAEPRWHYGVPGAAVALMAVAATLLPGLAVAQDVYVRTGIDLSRPADTHFTDADCASPGPGRAVRLRPGRRRRAAPVGGRRWHGRRR